VTRNPISIIALTNGFTAMKILELQIRPHYSRGKCRRRHANICQSSRLILHMIRTLWICMPFKKLITTLLHPEIKDASHPERDMGEEKSGECAEQYRKLQLAEIAFPTRKAL